MHTTKTGNKKRKKRIKTSDNKITKIINLSSSNSKSNNSNLNIIYFNNMKMKEYELSERKQIQNSFLVNMKNSIDINIEEYLATEPDDMDYDDAKKKDKREMCQIFLDNLKNKQILMNTFYAKDPLKPRPIKILLFILDISLYLFINGLFFNEEYISNFLHEKKTFFKFIERLSERFLYIALVGIIISYIIDFFFIEERKIKGIFKREKDNLVILNYEITRIISIIRKRFNLFIILSYIINIFILFHILCFNIVYPSIKEEWLKTSFIIIFIIQLLSLLECFLSSIIRIISFKCKSEKLYKLSYLLG